MKLCRISHPSFESARYAGLLGSNVFPLPVDYNFGEIKIPNDEGMLHLADVKLLAPVAPSKIVCVGRNYREHAAELGNKMPDEPLLFLKAPSAVVASDDQDRKSVVEGKSGEPGVEEAREENWRER